jgi:hypothetical protein
MAHICGDRGFVPPEGFMEAFIESLKQSLPSMKETLNIKAVWRNDRTLANEAYLRQRFYVERVMPCCGNKGYYEGPRGGLSINIKCAHCEKEFNICPEARFIEEI